MMAAGSPADARGQAESVQRKALIAALETVEKAPEVERRLVRGRPSEVLCIAGLDAELLVVGSRGHSTVHGVFVGSTSQRVLRHAPCPVVVLPDPQHVEHEVKQLRRRQRRPSERPTVAPMF
jgi:nucleotide-binding universal stress UspA family protein